MFLDSKDLATVLNELNDSFPGLTVEQMVNTVRNKKVGIQTPSEIEFFDGTNRTNFNWKYLKIHSNKRINKTDIERISVSKDCKNIFLETLTNGTIKIKKDNGIFVSLEKVPIKEFLKYF